MKNCWNYLYWHLKSFRITLKPNSYLTSTSRHGPVSQSTQIFPISIWHEQWHIRFSLGESVKNGCNELSLLPKVFHRSSISVNLATTTFQSYRSHKSNQNFTCCFKNHKKMAATISISTLINLISVKNHFRIWRHFPVVAITFGNISLTETKMLRNLVENGGKNINLCFTLLKSALKPNSICQWRFPVVPW